MPTISGSTGGLRTAGGETWFKGQPLCAATTLCRLFGQALSRGEDHQEDASRNRVHATGFDVARPGEATLRKVLDRIAASATGPLEEPNKTFGPLYTGLNYSQQCQSRTKMGPFSGVMPGHERGFDVRLGARGPQIP
jgi:hypothetical protein